MKRLIGTLKIDLIFYLDHLKKSKESKEFKEIIEVLEVILDDSKDLEAIQDEIPRLMQLAEHRNSQSVEAAYLLGMIYLYGIGVSLDHKQAVEYLQKAVNSGHAPAQRDLGLCFRLGEGVKQNYKQAVDHCTLSANQNWGPGFHYLAQAYENDFGLKKDMQLAFFYYSKGAEQDYALSLNDLAICYKNGLGVTKNLDRAFELFRSAAEKGFSDAQANLACCYFHGTVIKRDLEKSLSYLKMAFVQGHPQAQHDLAVFYMSPGNGFDLDFKRAVELLTLSAGQKYNRAQYYLGLKYLDGFGIFQNFERAILLLLAAKEKEYADSLKKLVELYGNVNNIPNLKTMVLGFLNPFSYIEQGITKIIVDPQDDKAAETLSILAFCTQMGLYVQQNIEVAETVYFGVIKYYTKKNNLEAISRLHWDLYFCYQNQSQNDTRIKFDTTALPVLHEKIKLSVSEGNKHDLELLGYMNEKNDLNLEGNWYAAAQSYQEHFNHFQKELGKISAVTDTSEKEGKRAKEEPMIELEMDEAWRKSLEGLRFQEIRKTPIKLIQQKIDYSDQKLRLFTPLLKLQDDISAVTNLNASIAALIVAYARDTDVQKLK